MRYVWVFFLCVFALVIFCAGGAFVFLLPKVQEWLHAEHISRNFTLEITQEVPITYQRYEGAIWFEARHVSKQTEQAANNIASTLNEMISHIAKVPFCTRTNTSAAPQSALEWIAVGGEFVCVMTEDERNSYQALLKELDYLALKNGNVAVRVAPLRQAVDRAQIDEARHALRVALLQQAQHSVAFYSEQMGQTCSLISSKELKESSPSSVIRRALKGGNEGRNSMKKRDERTSDEEILQTNIDAVAIDSALETQAHIPLATTSPLIMRAEIVIACK